MGKENISQATQDQVDMLEAMQTECHNFTDNLVERARKKGNTVNYQDAMNVWLFSKLAEQELRIKFLEKENEQLDLFLDKLNK